MFVYRSYPAFAEYLGSPAAVLLREPVVQQDFTAVFDIRTAAADEPVESELPHLWEHIERSTPRIYECETAVFACERDSFAGAVGDQVTCILGDEGAVDVKENDVLQWISAFRNCLAFGGGG